MKLVLIGRNWAEPLYLTRYIERMGTGDMIRHCRESGLAEPDFAMRDGFVVTVWRHKAAQPESRSPPVTPPVTPQVTPPVVIMLRLPGERAASSGAA